jgi:hypothetical protein
MAKLHRCKETVVARPFPKWTLSQGSSYEAERCKRYEGFDENAWRSSFELSALLAGACSQSRHDSVDNGLGDALR